MSHECGVCVCVCVYLQVYICEGEYSKALVLVVQDFVFCVCDFRSICEGKYGKAPEMVLNGHLNATFPYIQPPLEYILTELLKNSFR